ncbi:MAG: DUF4357 domain-containing protein [Desulfobacteraceae bacterium]|nr:DUF4357 domain-containing protein [Desulfobacteraceae bacterium]
MRRLFFVQQYLKTIRKDLITTSVVIKQGQHYVFNQSYAFGSPSTAAGVVLGRSANGRIEWENDKGKSLKDIQSEAIEPMVAPQ